MFLEWTHGPDRLHENQSWDFLGTIEERGASFPLRMISWSNGALDLLNDVFATSRGESM